MNAVLALWLAAAAAAAERPPILGIAHVAFHVSDAAKARAFYGGLLGYPESQPLRFAVNGRQHVELIAGLPAGQDERLSHVAFETADLAALRAYLADKGVKAAAGEDGGLRVRDPDGHTVEFVERAAPPSRGDEGRRISDRLLHVGLTVADPAAADRFYKDVLGFAEIWRGGRTEGETSWINMKVPDGTDYLEYMLVSGKVDRERLGTLHHLALRVPDIQAALETLQSRPGGLDRRTVRAPQIGRNNRWQLNLYDPDGTRCELMEPFTTR
jgi:catechol 2,3-dioxygenase-like lactoylglutathione lyase family enzyme